MDDNSAGALFAEWILQENTLADEEATMRVTAAKSREIGEKLNQLIRDDSVFRHTLMRQITTACHDAEACEKPAGTSLPYRVAIQRDPEDAAIARLISIAVSDKVHITLENHNGAIDSRLKSIAGHFHDAVAELESLMAGNRADEDASMLGEDDWFTRPRGNNDPSP